MLYPVTLLCLEVSLVFALVNNSDGNFVEVVLFIMLYELFTISMAATDGVTVFGHPVAHGAGCDANVWLSTWTGDEVDYVM